MVLPEWLTPALLLSVIALAGKLIHQYNIFTNKLRELELRVQIVEKQDDRIPDKLDDIADTLKDVQIELSNKQNK